MGFFVLGIPVGEAIENATLATGAGLASGALLSKFDKTSQEIWPSSEEELLTRMEQMQLWT